MRTPLLAAAALISCTGQIAVPEPYRPPLEVEGPCVPGAVVPSSQLLRITRAQADNLVADLLKPTFVPSSVLPGDEKLGPFAVNANTSVSRGLAEQYQFVAEQVGLEVQANVQRFAPCADTSASGAAACGRAFVKGFGRRAFRRALDAAADGSLAQPAGFDAQVSRLLSDPRGKGASTAFAEAWAGIEQLPAAASSPGRLGPSDRGSGPLATLL
ncbi:MAG: DUF1592 domain-containing protein [Archangiaceae bacterium]|nr:DUF1592 domain-containing protein [Archangiaceae bacterium]